MEFIDYYKVLEVERDAKPEELTKAYKRLARKYHPDLNKSKDAEERFKQLNEAYEVLKDPEKRKRYDMLGANWKHGAPFEPPPGWTGGFGGPGVRVEDLGGFGFSDFFSAIFGGGGFGRRTNGRGGRRTTGGQSVNIEELFGGLGGQAGGPARQAADVESTVTVQLADLYNPRRLSLELDGPAGKKRYGLKIPPGTRDGDRIRLAGQGMPGRGGAPGDLYLTVRVAPDPRFAVEGDDLVVELPVAAWDAALGARMPVPTLDGEVQMTLPKGLSSGRRLRLRGKGLPRRGGGRGDLFAQVKIIVPERLSPQQEELFVRLRALSAGSNSRS